MDEQMKLALQEALNEFKSALPQGLTKEEMMSEVKSLESRLAEQFQAKDYESEIKSLKDAMIALEEKASKPSPTMEQKSIADALLGVFEEKGVKSFSDLKKFGTDEMEVKADNEFTTASQTGTIMRTQEVSPVSFPRVRPYAFLRQPGIRTGTVENGKSVLLWTPAAYTSNAGYVGEFAAITNGNLATSQEKTRKMAKLGARQIMTQETFEDLPQFAQRVQAKLVESVELKFDELILSGEGNDATKSTEVYGLKTDQMTAFDPTVVDKVVSANVSDVVDACATQAELDLYKTNTIWMNPKTANRLRRTKDTTGQYVINQLITGELVLGGHNVIANKGIGAAEMIVGDISAIQIWFKRNFTMKMEELPSLDAWAMYVYLRAQVLVEDEDIKGLIYVSDVAAAVDAITVNPAGEA